jgi:uncharacterized protein YyaL (SSP411 family)
MVAWPLAELASQTTNERYASAARRNVEFALSQQNESDAWLSGYGLGSRPNFLHFIAYTLQGILEVGSIQSNDRFIGAVRRSTDRLLTVLERTGRMPGAFAEGWKPDAPYGCMTGNAQLAIVCFRLFDITGEERYFEAGQRLNAIVKNTMWVQGPSGLRGAIKGSDPIWGKYLPLRYPNWAAKFVADALRLEMKYAEVSA